MGIIIMPYYKNKSFEDFLKEYKGADKIDKIKHIITNVITNIYTAYHTVNFTHGDLFPKNIVLTDNFEPIIIDFEKSLFKTNIDRFWLDIDDFLNDISRYYIFTNEFDNIIREYIIMNRAYNKPPNDDIIAKLNKAIISL